MENLRHYLDGRHEQQDDQYLSEYGLPDGPENDLSTKPTQNPSVSLASHLKCVFFGMQWFFLVVNAVVEGCKALLAELNAYGEITPSHYYKWSAVTASFCLVLAFVKFIQELRESNATWGSRRHCWWFYHQGKSNRCFGRWLLYFDVLSSGIQLGFSLLALNRNKEVLRFDYVALLLAWSSLIAYAFDSKEKTTTCEIHGCDVECPECKLEALI